MTDRDGVERYYDVGAAEEYARLVKSPLHEAEYELTVELVREYIAPGSRVLDVGAGPGRYADLLIDEMRCEVGLVDLSQACLDEFLRRRGGRQEAQVLFATRCCATDLGSIDDGAFDAVLLMGPLYHLIEARERQAAAGESWRVLRPGGHVFAAFVSPWPAFGRLLADGGALLDDRQFIEDLTQRGITRVAFEGVPVEFFRCWPAEAVGLMEGAGFETIRLRNLEGVGSCLRREQVEALADSRRRQAWFDILRATCEAPDVPGATIHFLYVGHKPALIA